ncbi:reverse transcriptase [Phytophthora megakarya]|uniref:Reverse transcriptase n=1 Tax=Phytophthora megakarya TaxID=4795 RepID=A0A225UXQ8_9STRA|nr:reverse transcriptase [Phytophthora megakarya]
MGRNSTKGTSTILYYFPIVSAKQLGVDQQKDFKSFRKKSTHSRKARERRPQPSSGCSRLHHNDVAWGLVSQNVNGLGSTQAAREEWFSSFKQQGSHGRHDIVLLQETHVKARDVKEVSRIFSATWGFRAVTPPLSYWSPTDDNKGGVAVLVDPYGAFSNVTPLLEHKWSPHFMELQGFLGGSPVVLLNIYAPCKRGKREAFFTGLAELQIPRDCKVLMGGDFNCTLDPVLDRNRPTAPGVHDSPALRRLLRNWALEDAIMPFRPSRDGWTAPTIAHHHALTHTYGYTVKVGGTGTSRLDRWYLSANAHEWIGGLEVLPLKRGADHHAVVAQIRSPIDPIRIRKATKVFPVPAFASEAVRDLTVSAIRELSVNVKPEETTGQQAAASWDHFKSTISKLTKQRVKQLRRRCTRSYRRRLRRLRKQLDRAIAERLDNDATIATITADMDVLTLEKHRGFSKVQRARAAIAELQRDRALASKTRMFRSHEWNDQKTTKEFFRRVSTKFGDNVIPTLQPVDGCPKREVHDKANILADAWTPILQQSPGSPEAQRSVLSWIGYKPNDFVHGCHNTADHGG